MEPLISIIVPAYNVAPWISRCLDSILAQTYSNLEILVVDDGSTDDTPRILREYAERDSRIHPVHKENGGLASARLAGIVAVSGEWVGFVDGDDAIEPDMYERLWKNAMDYGADISHCGYVMLYPNGNKVYYRNSGEIRVQDNLLGQRDLLEEDLIQPSVCNKLYKASLFYDLEDKYTTDIWNNEDMLLNFYLFSRSRKAVFEDFCPYLYCLREGSLSQRKPTVHTIYDPIIVKQRILRDCDPVIRDDVLRATVGTLLYIYAQLCRGMEKEYAQDRKKVRSIIRDHLKHLNILSVKNAVMTVVVSYVPFVFHMIYGFYYRFIKKTL